jgi:hypothetical protein
MGVGVSPDDGVEVGPTSGEEIGNSDVGARVCAGGLGVVDGVIANVHALNAMAITVPNTDAARAISHLSSYGCPR